MEENKAVFVAVLGHGQVQRKLDLNTEIRVLHGLARVRELEAEGTPVSGIIVMASYAERLMAVDEALSVVPSIVNHGNDKVWGTLHEMRWAYERAKKHVRRPLRIEFVTNRRHGRRVLLANQLLVKIPDIGVVASNDKPLPVIHEGLGYLKLLSYFLHLDKPAEAMRRKYYRR